MHKSIAALVLAILAITSAPGELSAATRVLVCVETAAAVPREVLDRAEVSAGKVFALVPLPIEWRNKGTNCPGDRDAILLSLTTNTPKDYFPRAYGMALPYEGIHARVFYDRIQGIPPDRVVPFLAHALAHEIVHVLEGTDFHAETGVMKRRWSESDVQKMMGRPLPFSDLDILLLKLGVRGRHARLAAVPNDRTVSQASIPSE